MLVFHFLLFLANEMICSGRMQYKNGWLDETLENPAYCQVDLELESVPEQTTKTESAVPFRFTIGCVASRRYAMGFIEARSTKVRHKDERLPNDWLID